MLTTQEVDEAYELLSFFEDATEWKHFDGPTPESPEEKWEKYPEKKKRLRELLTKADPAQRKRIELEYPIKSYT